jgi:hypothetical protein
MNDDQLDHTAGTVLDIIWLLESQKDDDAIQELYKLEAYLSALQKVADITR